MIKSNNKLPVFFKEGNGNGLPWFSAYIDGSADEEKWNQYNNEVSSYLEAVSKIQREDERPDLNGNWLIYGLKKVVTVDGPKDGEIGGSTNAYLEDGSQVVILKAEGAKDKDGILFSYSRVVFGQFDEGEPRYGLQHLVTFAHFDPAKKVVGKFLKYQKAEGSMAERGVVGTVSFDVWLNAEDFDVIKRK